MVIQRWQSVLLLISAIFVALVGILPYAVTANGVDVCAVQTPVLLCVDILVALLLLIDIFLYRNLRYQMKVTRLALPYRSIGGRHCGIHLRRARRCYNILHRRHRYADVGAHILLCRVTPDASRLSPAPQRRSSTLTHTAPLSA